MIFLLLGGSKSGKSHLAQSISSELACGGSLVYWATMEPTDDEDRVRIENHLIDRCGLGFETVECGRNLLSSADQIIGSACVLFDSLTAVLANEMFCCENGFDESAPLRLVADLTKLAGLTKNIVFVCDDIFRDGMVYDEWTEIYRKGLAFICRSIAEICDVVVEVVSGMTVLHKGAEKMVKISQ